MQAGKLHIYEPGLEDLIKNHIQAKNIIFTRETETAINENDQDYHCTIVETYPKAFEMIKYAANSFLASKISYINELARVCEKLSINVNDVSNGIGLDYRIGAHFLKAGMGYEGSCFSKDVKALIQTAIEHGNPLSILEAVFKVIAEQSVYFFKKIKQALGSNLKNKRIAVLGLSFKENMDDMQSPGLILIDKLIEERPNIRAHNSIVKLTARQFQTVEETVADADAVILCTVWENYRNLHWESLKLLMNKPFIFDGKNSIDKEKGEKLGFHYLRVSNH